MPEIDIPEPIAREINEELNAILQARLKEAATVLSQSEMRVWKADEPLPPSHKEFQSNGAGKYHGEVANGYDAKREASPKWQAEQRIVEDMLSDLPVGSWVLDCPVGTGRFLPFYKEKGFIVRCMDLSQDMLAIAAEKGKDNLQKLRFDRGDVRATGLADKSVDAAVMVRLTRWLSPEDCVVALRELQRVTRRKIIFTARVRNHPHARGYDLIGAALDGWEIARDDPADGEDYRVIALEPAEHCAG